ncbi:MAG: sycD7 [Chlamydiia bacterium]|nr:sycD7 [Chlamydiia bacterium]
MESVSPEEFSMKIPDEFLGELEKPDMLKKFIDSGKSLQEMIGYSDELMEELYQSASQVFEEGRYQESQDGFLFLTTLNPYVYAYWIGLAMSYQLLEEYEQALLAYECAAALDPESPLPYYYQAACHLLMNEAALAQASIDILKDLCKDSLEHAALLEKGLQAEVRIKKHKS